MEDHSVKISAPRNSSIGYFNGASNITALGSTFNAIMGDYYGSSQGMGLAGLRILSQAISHGAMFDSAERYPAGKCHPGTRAEVQDIILDWTNDPTPSESVLWLYGPAGAGKSSIAQSIAEIIRELEKRYAGSFFFARGVLGRDGATTVFSTLAYQIATHVPEVRNMVDDAVLADNTLLAKSIDVQLKALIADPLSRSSNSANHIPTVIIDGLDECGNSHTQRDVLRLIAKAVTHYQVPLRFLIVSRPEFWIQNSFDAEPLLHITKRVSLGDSGDVDTDIETYLRDGFAEIYANNSDVMAAVEQPWPPTDVIKHLVREASGQFIYATIVLKFVGASSDFSDPKTQLNMITQPGPTRSSAFQELDTLYSNILSLYPRRESLLVVLGGILTGSSPKAIELFLGVTSTELKLVLRAISAVVNIQKPKSSQDDEDLNVVYGTRGIDVSFCHLSFREFLLDKTRSEQFWIDIQPIHKRLLEGFVRTITESVEGNFPHSHLPLMELDHMWHIFTRKTIFSIHQAVVYDQLQCLVTKFSKVQDIDLSCRISKPQYLLRYMDYMTSLVTVVETPLDFFDVDPFHFPKDTFSFLRQISVAIAYKCIDRILLDAQDGDLLTSMLVYIILSQSLTMDELGSMPGTNPGMAKTFLVQHWYLVKSSEIEGSDSDPVFFEIPSVRSYFKYVIEGSARTRFCAQAFLVSYRCLKHILYRYKASETSFDSDTLNSRFFDSVCSIAQIFLNIKEFSDVENGEAFGNYSIESMITLLWEYDWSRLKPSCGHYFSLATSHRLAEVLEETYPGFSDKLRYIMKRIYSEIFLPTVEVPFFSELCMYDADSIRIISLKPTWDPSGSRAAGDQIQIDKYELWSVDVDHVYIQSYIYTRIPELDSILSRALYLQHHITWYARLLEFYLSTLVKGLYNLIHPEFKSYALLASFTEGALHSVHNVPYPTEKMVNALRALCYLSRWPAALPWSPPAGFSPAIMELLQRTKDASATAQEIAYLIEWLEEIAPPEMANLENNDGEYELDWRPKSSKSVDSGTEMAVNK